MSSHNNQGELPTDFSFDDSLSRGNATEATQTEQTILSRNSMDNITNMSVPEYELLYGPNAPSTADQADNLDQWSPEVSMGTFNQTPTIPSEIPSGIPGSPVPNPPAQYAGMSGEEPPVSFGTSGDFGAFLEDDAANMGILTQQNADEMYQSIDGPLTRRHDDETYISIPPPLEQLTEQDFLGGDYGTQPSTAPMAPTHVNELQGLGITHGQPVDEAAQGIFHPGWGFDNPADQTQGIDPRLFASGGAGQETLGMQGVDNLADQTQDIDPRFFGPGGAGQETFEQQGPSGLGDIDPNLLLQDTDLDMHMNQYGYTSGSAQEALRMQRAPGLGDVNQNFLQGTDLNMGMDGNVDMGMDLYGPSGAGQETFETFEQQEAPGLVVDQGFVWDDGFEPEQETFEQQEAPGLVVDQEFVWNDGPETELLAPGQETFEQQTAPGLVMDQEFVWNDGPETELMPPPATVAVPQTAPATISRSRPSTRTRLPIPAPAQTQLHSTTPATAQPAQNHISHGPNYPGVVPRQAPMPTPTPIIKHSTRGKAAEVHPSEVYQALEAAPASWGPPGYRDLFSYTKTGDWDTSLTLSAADTRFYVKNAQTHGKRPLKVWIQHYPAQRNYRYTDDGMRKCRWEGCPSKSNTILKGFYRVAFDERPKLSGEVTDPFHNAGYMHLHCFEKIFDVYELIAHGPAEIDTRTFSFEERNPMAVTDGHPQVATAVKKWNYAQLEATEKYWAGLPAGMDKGTAKGRVIRKEQRLWYALTSAYVAMQGESRRAMRAKRNGNSIDKHVGDLDLFLADETKRRDLYSGAVSRLKREAAGNDSEDEEVTVVKRPRGRGPARKAKRAAIDIEDTSDDEAPMAKRARRGSSPVQLPSPVADCIVVGDSDGEDAPAPAKRLSRKAKGKSTWDEDLRGVPSVAGCRRNAGLE